MSDGASPALGGLEVVDARTLEALPAAGALHGAVVVLVRHMA